MESSPADHRIPWSLVILAGSLTALAPLSIDMYLASLPAIQKTFGASHEATQATLATFLIGLAIGQFVYGPLSDRVGRRGPLLFGLALYVAASARRSTAWRGPYTARTGD